MGLPALSSSSGGLRLGLAGSEPGDHSAVSCDWLRLQPLWQVDAAGLQEGSFALPIAPHWRLLLLNDGSTTRNLSAIAGVAVSACTIDTCTIDPARDSAPEAISLLDRPTLRRQVWLTASTGERLMYGVSWWNPDLLHRHLHDPELPIGQNLSQRRTELFRELHGLEWGKSEALAAAFDAAGPFWGRSYLLWHQQEPLTLIYEVFSSAIGPILTSS